MASSLSAAASKPPAGPAGGKKESKKKDEKEGGGAGGGRKEAKDKSITQLALQMQAKLMRELRKQKDAPSSVNTTALRRAIDDIATKDSNWLKNACQGPMPASWVRLDIMKSICRQWVLNRPATLARKQLQSHLAQNQVDGRRPPCERLTGMPNRSTLTRLQWEAVALPLLHGQR
jgi:hypothetical protein